MPKNTIDVEAGSNRIAALRKEYTQEALDIGGVDPDPMAQFERWFREAAERGVVEPNAMVVSTVSSEGRPSARAVLLKEFGAEGFVFFTNSNSRKGREMAVNPWAALLFLWSELERQIRIEGRVERVDAALSDRYFASRPRGAQLSAHASTQSERVENRGVLEARMAELEKRFAGLEIPRPAYWGGFRVVPEVIEFWQGRPDRLHDRVVYTRSASDRAVWTIARLQP